MIRLCLYRYVCDYIDTFVFILIRSCTSKILTPSLGVNNFVFNIQYMVCVCVCVSASVCVCIRGSMCSRARARACSVCVCVRYVWTYAYVYSNCTRMFVLVSKQERSFFLRDAVKFIRKCINILFVKHVQLFRNHFKLVFVQL
eukprot:m.228909 g.228909  ORF g.228909 m.228909 type:complete len:143 (+) comp33548_c8_seq18:70-498(+)